MDFPTNSDVQRDEIVVFHDDRPVETKTLPAFKEEDSAMRTRVTDSQRHDIINFLQRPIIIHQGSWSVTDTAGSSLYSTYVPYDIIHNNAMIYQKLCGFYGLRCSVVIRVQVNAQRFQQGRLLLTYFPQAQLNPHRHNLARHNLTTLTQLPRVEIDASTDSSACLKLPYVSPSEYYRLSTAEGPIGHFHLSVYSPLTAGSGPSSCNYTVWAHFEDIELVFPTVAFSQMDMSSKGLNPNAKPFVPRNGPLADEESDVKLVSSDKPQSILSRIPSKKPSEWLYLGAGTASFLGNIPLLAPVAKPVSWVMTAVAGVASFFGFSKRKNNTAPIRVQTSYLDAEHLVDGAITGPTMGAVQDNRIQHVDGIFGTSIDEMSFAYLFSIPAFVESFDWESTDVPGTTLWYRKLKLSADQFVLDSGGATPFYWTPPFAYVANFFQYWRGSINFHFKIVKTEFHSGRLEFIYAPGVDAATAIGNSSAVYCYREILDVRTSNEFVVSVPYVYFRPYAGISDTTGTVFLNVLNDVVAPDSVSSTISILVEMSAGKDFEVAVPCGENNWSPINPVYLTSEGDFEVNVDRSGESSNVRDDVGAINGAVYLPSLAGGATCIGERLTSVRQLVKRHAMVWQDNLSKNHMIWTVPGVTSLPQVAATGGSVVKNGITWLDAFRGLYAYSRGSYRVTVGSYTSSNVSWFFRLGSSYPLVSPSFKNGFSTSSPLTSEVSDASSQPVITSRFSGSWGNVTIPNYGPTKSYVNWLSDATTTPTSSDFINPNVLLSIPSNYDQDRTERYWSYISAGDDFSLGFFIGTMPLASTNASVPNYPHPPSA